MVSKDKIKLYLERAENELRLAKAIFTISANEEIKSIVGVNPGDSFYSAVISHCYYSMFYSAKAILLTLNVDTKAPEVHRKTYEKLKWLFVDTGKLDRELFELYDEAVMIADQLLDLFKEEKWKRGHFTYQTISQANIKPAEESIKNAKKFVSTIKEVIKL